MDVGRLEAKHLAFFSALGTLDPASPEWAAAKAGLVTLRLVDDWVARGAPAVALGDRGRRAVETTIEALPRTDAERQLLANLVAAMTRASRATVAGVAAPLLAYAYTLQVRAAWALAADVYELVFEGCGGAEADAVDGDPAGAATAALRLGACYRQLGVRDRAAEAYHAAEHLGVRVGDRYTVLKAQLRLAKLTTERGNLPAAEESFDRLVVDTTIAGYGDLRAEALHERAHVAHRRGQYARAATLAYEAWMETSDPVERDRVLVGLAASLQDMGEHEAARDANLLLAAQARDPSTRWVATINLIELAALDGREVEFMRYRRALERAPLPPPLAGYYHLYVAKGFQAFGKSLRARAELDQAIALAEAHGLNELLIQAEAARTAVAQESEAPIVRHSVLPAASGWDASVSRVATAIRQVRQSAGVSG